MEKYKKLIGNSLVFAIGNFGSKAINILMVPLYTFFMTPGEYGVVDLFNTTISLFLPIITISISEAVIRFTLDKINEEKSVNKVLSNAIFINVISILICTLLYPVLSYFELFEGYLFMFILLLSLNQLEATYTQFTRAIGKIKQFAINGLVMTLLTACFNIIFLVYMSLGTNGFLLSLILSNSISIIYLYFVTNSFERVKIKLIDFKLIKYMIKYSIPLIPNMIMWWLINSSTRYFILFFVDATANGIFAVANKIPTILSMFTSIFQQAWQLSVFEEFKNNDKDKFYSQVFKIYYKFLFTLSSLIIPFLHIIVPIIIDDSFIESWQIIPILLVAVIYQSFSSFVGTIYTASMNTKGIFVSSIIGGLISVLLNFILVPYYGLTGAGFSSALSFVCMFVIRYYDTKKDIKLNIDFRFFIFNNIMILLQIVLIRVIGGAIILFVVNILVFFILLVFNCLSEKKGIIKLKRIIRK
ncbi:hypothetical protein IGI73_001075 [Enterococcus sp. DIV0755f]|uniref:lipopolysaccharide biosynthesis protein n=1 Tax=Enterococcus TaxID=1350 RepID=UPI003D0DCED0